MSDKPPTTYQDIWDQYAEGRLSTSVVRRLLEDDEVFRQWCVRKAAQTKRTQPSKPAISDEDMA